MKTKYCAQSLSEGKEMTMINDVRAFMQAGGQTVDNLNVRQYALYTGLQLEEMAEKLLAIGLRGAASRIDVLADEFKKGFYDAAILNADLVELIDADIDSQWVSIGALLSSGAMAQQAWAEVVRSNMSKLDPTTGKMIKNADGKVIKPPHFSKPDLAKFLPKGE